MHEVQPVYLGLLVRREAMGGVLVGVAIPDLQVKDVEVAVYNLSLGCGHDSVQRLPVVMEVARP